MNFESLDDDTEIEALTGYGASVSMSKDLAGLPQRMVTRVSKVNCLEREPTKIIDYLHLVQRQEKERDEEDSGGGRRSTTKEGETEKLLWSVF